MVSLSQIQEDEVRSQAGMNKKNIIVDPKVLRKELLKRYYAECVNEMIKIICSCDLKESKPNKVKGKKGEPSISPTALNDMADIGDLY